jgi:hypothetical protein
MSCEHYHISRAVGLSAAALLAATASTVATGDDDKVVFAVERVALSGFLVDEKDQPLAKALAMLPARIHELPHQIPDMPGEVLPVIDLALGMLSQPARVALVYDETMSGGAWGYGGLISFRTGGEEEAGQYHAAIGGMMASAMPSFKPSAGMRVEGMNDVMLPFGLLSYGPREGADGWRYEVIAGSVSDADAPFDAMPDAAWRGFSPVIRGHLDFEGLNPAASIARTMATGYVGDDAEVEEIFNGLHEMKILGDNTLKIDFQLGYTDEMSVSQFVVEGYGEVEGMWAASHETLTRSDFAVIPADADVAAIGSMTWDWVQEMVDGLADDGIPVHESLEQFEQLTGVNMMDDVLGSLGGKFAYYTSDATGGGSFASMVVLVGLEDRGRFKAADAKLRKFAHTMIDQHMPLGPGYIRATDWRADGVDLVSLRFPGLPVPFELTYALTEDWLVFGATPQAALAAARQASGSGDRGILANPAFSEMLPNGKQLVSASFIDTKSLMRSGYPLVSLVGSAVANGMRSPFNPEREPGLIVPTYADLADGAKATVQVSYWDGDDWITESYGDRSQLVNLTGGLGMVMKFAPLIAIPAAAAGVANAQQFGLADEFGIETAPVLAELWRHGMLPPGALHAALVSVLLGDSTMMPEAYPAPSVR